MKILISILFLLTLTITGFAQSGYRCDNVTKPNGTKGTLYVALSGLDFDVTYNSVAIKWKAYTSQANFKARENGALLQIFLLDTQAKAFRERASTGNLWKSTTDAAIWAGNAYGFIPDHTNVFTDSQGKQQRWAVIKSLNDLDCAPFSAP